MDNYFQLRWQLLLDPLFLHGSGGFLYISIMEDEQCKPQNKKHLYSMQISQVPLFCAKADEPKVLLFCTIALFFPLPFC